MSHDIYSLCHTDPDMVIYLTEIEAVGDKNIDRWADSIGQNVVAYFSY